MSLSYDLFYDVESLYVKTPKSINGADEMLDSYFTKFKKSADIVTGRLYAMLKKLTGEGAVNTNIKYLKVKLLDNPSQLVTRVSDRVLEEVLFNEDVCKYDVKTLNHPVAKRCCEEHLTAIKQLLDMEKTFKHQLTAAKRTKNTDDDKIAIRMMINLRQVSKHLLWSSRRLLTNIRLH